MKKMIPLLLLFGFSLFSCSQSGVVILVDPWWEAAHEQSVNLKKTALIKGLTSFRSIPVYRAVDKDQGYNLLENALGRSEEMTVLVSPAFFSYLDEWNFSEKKINYILLNGFYDDPADNVIAVYSSRDEVYYMAGSKAARFSESNGNCAVAAVFYDTERRRSERDSFVKGFEESEVGGELLISDQQTYFGGDKLIDFINKGPTRNVGLFFFSASSLNSFCLDQALPLSIPISGENVNSLGFGNELIEFSIDDDMMKIVETALKLGLDGEAENDYPVKPRLWEKGNHF